MALAFRNAGWYVAQLEPLRGFLSQYLLTEGKGPKRRKEGRGWDKALQGTDFLLPSRLPLPHRLRASCARGGGLSSWDLCFLTHQSPAPARPRFHSIPASLWRGKGGIWLEFIVSSPSFWTLLSLTCRHSCLWEIHALLFSGWQVSKSSFSLLIPSWGHLVCLLTSCYLNFLFFVPLHVRKPLKTQIINHLPSGKGYMTRAGEQVCADFPSMRHRLLSWRKGIASGVLPVWLSNIWSNARCTVEIKNFVLVINILDF